MKFVQHRMDPAKWIQHFKEQAMGVKHPIRDGYVFVSKQVGKGANSNKGSKAVNLVSPVQQVVDQARAEIKREGKGIKRKSDFTQPQLKKKSRRGKRPSSSSNKTRTTKKGHSKRGRKKVVTKKKSKNRDIFSK